MISKKTGSKVYVAMSGGVDSSVAAALLNKQGFKVVGVFFRPWSPSTVNCQLSTVNFCSWQQDRQDAMRVCAKLGIPFKTWDFSKEYEKEVVDYMIKGYRNGITPNPDVMCNDRIKFGIFLEKAIKEGADFIATGHYARLMRKSQIPNPKSQKNSKFPAYRTGRQIPNSKNYKSRIANHKLLKGIDQNKDQSYFLWTLTQKQLKHCLFPIGGYTKPEIRKLAKKFGLPNWNKKDSQGVCFVGQLDMKEFLKNYIKSKRGEIHLLLSVYDRSGVEYGQNRGSMSNVAASGLATRVVGYHDGVYYYTIGQRHGLDIKDGGGPYYVVGKDVSKNILYVARNGMFSYPAYAGYVNNHGRGLILDGDSIAVGNINWVVEKPKLPFDCRVKIRYRSKSLPAVISRPDLVTRSGLIRAGLLRVQFKKPAKATTPGQSAVFYKGEEVVGGGIII